MHIKISVALIKSDTVISNQYLATQISGTVSWHSWKHKFWNQVPRMMTTLIEFIFHREGHMHFLTSFRSFSPHCYSTESRDVYTDSGLCCCFGNLIFSERHILNCSLLWSLSFSINISCVTALIFIKSQTYRSLPSFI